MIKKINNVSFVLLTIIYIIFKICTLSSVFALDGIATYDLNELILLFLPLIFLILICFITIKNIIKKNKMLENTKYNYLILVNNACLFFSLIIEIILLMNSRFLLGLSQIYINDAIFIISFLSYIYIVLQGKNKKLHNNLMFLFSCLLLVYYLNESFSWSEFPFYLIFSIYLIFLFIVYIISLIKKNKVLYSNKYNLMLFIYNLLVVIMVSFYIFNYLAFYSYINDYVFFSILFVILIVLYFILLQLSKNKKTKVKKVLSLIVYHVLIIPFILTALYSTNVVSDVIDDYVFNQDLKKAYVTSKEAIKKQNDYSSKKAVLNYEFNYNLEVNNEKELKNLMYTLINSGQGEITLKCNYDGCLEENSETIYSYLNNNLVSVFNQHEDATYWCSSKDYCEVQIENKYSKENINEIEKYVNQIYNDVYDASKQDYDNIKAFHDYLIDNYNYDKATSRTELTALDFLKNKSSSSQGYSEIMSILLDKMEISNVIIEANYINKENEEMYHPWNLVKLDGTWLHLDVTLDDSDNKLLNNTDRYKYFLIDNDNLNSYNDELHKFNQDIYDIK